MHSALESLTLPADRLRPNTRYRWRVTYQFWPGTQEVSAESTLQPQSYQQHTSPFDLQPYFNADVISNPGDPANDAVDGDEDAFAAVAPDDTLFQRQHVGVHQLGHHTELNAIQLTDRHKTSITISAPTARRFDAIRILMTSGWKEAELPMRIVYADGSSQAVELHCEDWEHQPEDGMDRDPYFFGKDFVPLLRVAGVRASGNRRPGMAIFEANFATDPERELASIVLEPASMTGHSPRVEFPSRLNILAITGIRNDPSDDELCRCVVD